MPEELQGNSDGMSKPSGDLSSADIRRQREMSLRDLLRIDDRVDPEQLAGMS